MVLTVLLRHVVGQVKQSLHNSYNIYTKYYLFSDKKILSCVLPLSSSQLHTSSISTQSKMVKTRKYLLATHFEGLPKESDLKVIEEELPPLKNGEFLCEAEWLSVDPYMRPYTAELPLGITMIGSQVARVIESKHPDYKVGVHVVGQFGWQTKTVVNVEAQSDMLLSGKPYIVPDLKGLPLSLALGTLGMPGNTAYFGFYEICQPKAGEVVVVSGAAGAVGSHVGQLAKVKGCKVIGFAGSDDKVKWLTEELKFDAAYNYKKTDIRKALKEAAPDGVDCYFDNVGGAMSSAIIAHMNLFGRISVCGSISAYNATDFPKAPILQPSIVSKQLKMEGFIVSRWTNRWNEGIMYNMKLIKEGKLKYHESVTEGFDNMFKAFVGMLQGENVGKAVVKA